MAHRGKGADPAAVLRALAEKLDVFQTLREFPEVSAAQLRGMLLAAAERMAGAEPTRPPRPEAKGAVWQLFSDGASRGNPGPAGAGFLLIGPEGEVVCERAVPLGRATNNVAEYHALRLGIEAALERGVRRLRVCLDSELVVRQMSGRYRVKSPQLAEIHHQVKQLLAKLEWHDIVHVERGENRAADALANQAAAAVKV